jgi:hypothetical protein
LSAVPYTFANASGQVPAIQLDVNFANVKAAVDTAGIVTTNAQPNITSVGTLTALSITGNVTGGNVLTIGRVSATGNITGNYFIGNGSQLTGIAASYGNANVATFLAAYGSNTISTTGNISGSRLYAVDGVVFNSKTITAGFTLNGFNAESVGPIDLASGVEIDIIDGDWLIS